MTAMYCPRCAEQGVRRRMMDRLDGSYVCLHCYYAERKPR